MTDPREYLEDLGLDPEKKYTADQIKKAWRKLAAKHHPDKGGDPKEFMRIMHSYKMLTDPSYRHKTVKEAHPDRADLDVRMQVPVTFEEAFFGRDMSVSYNRIELDSNNQPIIKEHQEVIFVQFTLPPGSLDGHDVCLTGKGLKQGDRIGSLYLKVIPLRHNKFSHRGSEIVSKEQVPLKLMLKGGNLEVQTMRGLRTIKIPPATPPGAQIKIPGCGVFKASNHYVELHPIYPSEQDLKQKDWEGLDIKWDQKEDTTDIDYEDIFIKLTGDKAWK